jgi:hypothetical protein
VGLLVLTILVIVSQRQVRIAFTNIFKMGRIQARYLVGLRHLLLEIQQENKLAPKSNITLDQLANTLNTQGNKLGIQIRENLCDQIENLMEFYGGNVAKSVREDFHNTLDAYKIIPKRKRRKT